MKSAPQSAILNMPLAAPMIKPLYRYFAEPQSAILNMRLAAPKTKPPCQYPDKPHCATSELGPLHGEEGIRERLAPAYRAFPRFLHAPSLSEDEPTLLASSRRHNQLVRTFVHGLSDVFKVLIDIPLRNPQTAGKVFPGERSFLEDRHDPPAKRLVPLLRHHWFSYPSSLDHPPDP